jgi:hypothetical protein
LQIFSLRGVGRSGLGLRSGIGFFDGLPVRD